MTARPLGRSVGGPAVPAKAWSMAGIERTRAAIAADSSSFGRRTRCGAGRAGSLRVAMVCLRNTDAQFQAPLKSPAPSSAPQAATHLRLLLRRDDFNDRRLRL